MISFSRIAGITLLTALLFPICPWLIWQRYGPYDDPGIVLAIYLHAMLGAMLGFVAGFASEAEATRVALLARVFCFLLVPLVFMGHVLFQSSLFTSRLPKPLVGVHLLVFVLLEIPTLVWMGWVYYKGRRVPYATRIIR